MVDKLITLSGCWTQEDFLRAYHVWEKLKRTDHGKNGGRNKKEFTFYDENNNKVSRFTACEAKSQYFISKIKDYRSEDAKY